MIKKHQKILIWSKKKIIIFFKNVFKTQKQIRNDVQKNKKQNMSFENLRGINKYTS
jgi:hypothetical protein